MHDTALETGREFFTHYAPVRASEEPPTIILDIGALNINGSLRQFVPKGAIYVGCDITAGPEVDLILSDPYVLPHAGVLADLIVSTSCFEHTEFFWLTFTEMARILRPRGYIYINAPIGGPVHRHPVDCWRFYPDAGRALAQWATRCGHDIALVESFIRPPGAEGWSDFTATFTKRDADGRLVHPSTLLSDTFPDAQHIIIGATSP